MIIGYDPEMLMPHCRIAALPHCRMSKLGNLTFSGGNDDNDDQPWNLGYHIFRQSDASWRCSDSFGIWPAE